MAYLSLDPVSAAIYTALNVASLTALAPGGVGDSMAQRTTPSGGVFDTFVLYEVNENNRSSLGSKPGRNALVEIDLRVHVFTYESGPIIEQQVMAKVIELLSASNALTVTGYTVCGLEPFYDETLAFSDQMIAGIVVREAVSLWRLFVQEAAA